MRTFACARPIQSRGQASTIVRLIGESFEEVVRAVRNEADADELIGLFRHTLRTGEACVKADYRAERHDGVIEHYDWQIHRITLAEGGLGVACYFRDNSAEVRTRHGIVAAQQQLRASEMRYRRLFETAHDGILLLDAESARITDANPFITKLLGYSQAELVGKELWQIGLFADIAESKAAMQELQLKHFIRYENLPLQTKAGLKVELEFVDRRKNEFLAMLAHELRNPLAPIRNALQIMRLTGGDAQAVRSAASEMMERQVGQMVRLVDDLLDVSRISRGKIELRRGRIELASAVNHAVEAARSPRAWNHELTVTLAAAADLPERRPDPAGSGGGQPAQQRLQVHRQGRSHLAHGRASGRGGRYPSAGHRHRHRRRPASPHLRYVHAGRYLAGAFGQRVGHRPDAGEKPGGDARRHGGSPQCRCRSGQ